MFMKSECHDCVRLRSELAARTHLHFKLKGKLDIAAIVQDAATTETLSRELVQSARDLGDIRDQIDQHQQAAHRDQGAT